MPRKTIEEKCFLTYNQQMRKLRQDKGIDCKGSPHKTILIRSGYFNLINGYKNPFINAIDQKGCHVYIPDTSLDQIHTVKRFDDRLRSFLLRYITQVEEEVRALTSYKFDESNENGTIYWYDTTAFSDEFSLQKIMNTISASYTQISRSHLDYVTFYMENHQRIPTWIMMKAIDFSTFIDVLKYSKKAVRHSICGLYDITDQNQHPNVKLLIGSLHWMRQVRNSCAHNERIYSLSRDSQGKKAGGRILEKYFRQLRPSYARDKEQRIFDLIVYLKYYLPPKEYREFISELKSMMFELKSRIVPPAFNHIRAQMGIKNMDDLDILLSLSKAEIDYNKFDKN